jgi:hypothetical protein
MLPDVGGKVLFIFLIFHHISPTDHAYMNYKRVGGEGRWEGAPMKLARFVIHGIRTSRKRKQMCGINTM